MKIVMISENDYSGSGMRMRDAFRRHYPEHEIHLVTHKKTKHSADYVFAETVRKVEIRNPMPMSIQDRIKKIKTLRKLQKESFSEVQKLVDEADIIHFKGDEPPTRNWHDIITIPEDKKIVVTVGGSQFRRNAAFKGVALAKYQIAEYMMADLRTALTPDLNYPEFEGIYTQQAIDSENCENLFHLPAGLKQLKMAHSPSSLKRKGTESIFLPAVSQLHAKGKIFELDIIHNVPYQECVDRKKTAQIFFDQAICGFYGNAALEAMQFGIPTVSRISNEAIQQSDGKINRDCPVIAFRTVSANACEIALRKAVTGDLTTISRETKQFCDEFHSYSVVAKMWMELYSDLVQK